MKLTVHDWGKARSLFRKKTLEYWRSMVSKKYKKYLRAWLGSKKVHFLFAAKVESVPVPGPAVQKQEGHGSVEWVGAKICKALEDAATSRLGTHTHALTAVKSEKVKLVFPENLILAFLHLWFCSFIIFKITFKHFDKR